MSKTEMQGRAIYKVYIHNRLFFQNYYFNTQQNAYKAVAILRNFMHKNNFKKGTIIVEGPYPYTNSEYFESN